MPTALPGAANLGTSKTRAALDGSDQRTLEAIFRHPLTHNLKWTDVVALCGSIGEVEHKANNEFILMLDGERHAMRAPHTKDMPSSEIAGLRSFLLRSGWSADGAPPQRTAPAADAAPNLLVVLDHHEGHIYEIEAVSPGVSTLTVKPYDPHHFQHHLAHKDQSRESGQRTHEDIRFYEQLADGLEKAGKIVVVGHGKGHSNAASYLIEYLRTHRMATYQRIVREMEVDLSSTTLPQLLAIARSAL